jgi:phage-related protein
MLSEAILAVLAVIESILPLLGTSAATATAIANIINALTQLLPFIINEISTVYTSVKNIISLLQNTGAMTADQVTALQQLDSQVDAAWAQVLPNIDPDNPANKGTPAGDPAAS